VSDAGIRLVRPQQIKHSVETALRGQTFEADT
jgi:hypothetical protein